MKFNIKHFTAASVANPFRFPFGRHLKTLLWLLLANLALIGVLGLVLVMMSHETAHLLLSLAMSLCAGAVVGVTGYLCYQLLYIKDQQQFVHEGIDVLPLGLLIMVDGHAVFANRQLTRHFGDVYDDFLNLFITEFVAEDSAKKFHDLLSHSVQGRAAQEQVTITSHVIPSTSWFVEVIPISREANAQLWVFHPKDLSANMQGFYFLQTGQNFRSLFEASPMGVVLLGPQGKIASSNQFFRNEIIEGVSINPQTAFVDLLAESCRPEAETAINQLLAGHKVSMPIELAFTGHEKCTASLFATRIQEQGGTVVDGQKVSGLILNLFDNSAQKKIQLQLAQSQKMQAMGQLAGGIAHDFNNLLTAMVGFCDLLLSRHSPGDQSFTDIMQIKQNSNRAANLVRQLLAFSKQQTMQPQILDVKEALAEVSLLLNRLVSVDLKIEMKHAPDLGLIKVDKGQFEQVMINFVVNARDAMNNKGKIVINTCEKTYDKAIPVHHENLSPGRYVVIEVIDTGCGIAPENLARIFDPFFSTKEISKGTGLGLSMTYGIVKQTGGYILVESKLGQGTKFSLLFPRYEKSAEIASKKLQTSRKSMGDLTGTETILFVEDEAPVRLFGVRALRDKGYKVIEATSGQEALDKLQAFLDKGEGSVDLLISDIVMPEMDGLELTRKVRDLIPEVPVIYISGYAEDMFRDKVGKDDNAFFLAKPFRLKELAFKVKQGLKKADPQLEMSDGMSENPVPVSLL
ncbi:MAG: ATP-binding protein [Pseudomonadota bacterium]